LYPSPDAPTVRVGIVSDVHLRSADRAAVRDELGAVVDRFAGRVDRAVVLGDLIEDEDAATDRDHVRAVREAFDALDAPVTYLLGNHDVERLSRADLRELLGVERFHGRIGDTDLFSLDSAGPQGSGARGVVPDGHLAALDEGLADADDAVVFVHHPLAHRSLDDNEWFAEAPERAFCWNREEVEDVLARHDVRAVVNGHVHETAHVRSRGVDHFAVTAFNKEFPGASVTGTYAELRLGETLRLRVVEGDRAAKTFEVPSTDGA
jgi:Icc-related predicted phosphoesterase